MRLFMDTEFSDLVPHNKLISIALVDEDENYFYAELTDTYELSDCSPFVKSFVLPFLRGLTTRMTHYQCSLALANWVEARNVPCVIASDNPSWDLPHLKRLIDPLWPENLEKNMVVPVRVTDEQVLALVTKYDYDIHNALDDAMIMKKATLGY